MTCLIVGDSIAQGIAANRTDCVKHTQIGITSSHWDKQFLNLAPFAADTVIISLGTNDSDTANTYDNLNKLRQSIKSNCSVFWIVPNIKPAKRRIVQMLAEAWGDKIIDAQDYPVSPDHIHPTPQGYKKIANSIKFP